MTCAPASSSARAQLDVALLVEARGQLDQDGHLLVALGRPLQAGDDRRADAGAVQRLLDREHVGIVGGLRDQRDHRVVGLVGVVQQDVALVQQLEQVAAAPVRPRMLAGCSGGSRSASKPGRSVRPSSTRRSSGPGTRVHIFRRDVELVTEQRRGAPPTRTTPLPGAPRRCAAAAAPRARPLRGACARLRRRARARHRGRDG